MSLCPQLMLKLASIIIALSSSNITVIIILVLTMVGIAITAGATIIIAGIDDTIISRIFRITEDNFDLTCKTAPSGAVSY